MQENFSYHTPDLKVATYVEIAMLACVQQWSFHLCYHLILLSCSMELCASNADFQMFLPSDHDYGISSSIVAHGKHCCIRKYVTTYTDSPGTILVILRVSFNQLSTVFFPFYYPLTSDGLILSLYSTYEENHINYIERSYRNLHLTCCSLYFSDIMFLKR